MASQISMIAAEYQVRTITGDEFIVIYTYRSVTVEACLACFLCIFKSLKYEWVAGLDVEYTTLLESEKLLKEAIMEIWEAMDFGGGLGEVELV